MNYESEVEDIIIETLQNKLGIFHKQRLICYLRCRYMLINNKTKIDDVDFILFLLNILNIKDFTYKETIFSTYSTYENSYKNILDDIYFIYNKEYLDPFTKEKINFYNEEKKILKKIKNEISLKRNKLNNDYFIDKYILYYKLDFLNKIFDIQIKDTFYKLEGFNQQDELMLEFELERYLKASQVNTTNLNEITENIFETYLIEHLNLIEDNLTYITRQYILEEGRIDILAKDKDDNMVIIEVKTEDDKRLIWQCLYYPMQIKKKYNSDKVRMIVVCPSYPNYLLEPLNVLNVEKFSYNIKISNQKIDSLSLNRI